MNYSMQFCRLCASDKNVSFTIHNLDSDGKSLIDKLEAIVPEIVDCKIKLPNGICTICAVQLNEAYKFIKQCFDTQIILKQHLNEQLCRLCASNENITLTLNSMDSDNILLSSKLETISTEILTCNENLDDCICLNCSVRLNETYKFKEKCRGVFKQMQNTEVIIKKEIDEDDKEENSGNFETVYVKEEMNTKELSSENDINIKVETEYFVPHSELIIKEENSDLQNETDSNSCQVSSQTSEDFFLSVERHYLNRRKQHKCDICNLVCTRASSLISHRRTHFNEKPYKCEICDKGFGQSGSLVRHLRQHRNERNYSCEKCKKAFLMSSDLKRHIRSHNNVRPFSCEQCEKTFIRSAHLDRHVRSAHMHERPHKCDQCGKAYPEKSHLTRHIRTHHL